ncbi:TPA: hypothetical protein TXJ12_001751 [Streptococcus suis]|nr:hypothetical protein [Streptococcus suis]
MKKYGNNRVHIKIGFGLVIVFAVLYILDKYNILAIYNFPHDYNWLSFVGSLIGAWVTIYGIAETLRFEHERSEKDSRDNVRPVFNASGDISTFKYKKSKKVDLYSVSEENGDKSNHSFTVNNCIGFEYDYEIALIDGTQMRKSSFKKQLKDSPTICIKIRNIGMGHAIINEFKVTDSAESTFTYQLRPDERFAIDAGTSNVILLKLPTSDCQSIQIFFQDVLQTNYVYNMKIEYATDSQKKLIFVKESNKEHPIENFRVVSNVYFEEYFPEEC